MSGTGSPSGCPFCRKIDGGEVALAAELAVVLRDQFPVSPGHLLIVPRRHVADLFELTAAEQAAVWRLVPEARKLVERHNRPDGYNVGINVGAAAGQTVEHAHVHVIPRYAGDVPDPRGGVRWVVPGKAGYWEDR